MNPQAWQEPKLRQATQVTPDNYPVGHLNDPAKPALQP
jgi:hypothetical protein